jgi:hypothetical protein
MLSNDKPCHTTNNDAPARGNLNEILPQTLNGNSVDGGQKRSRIYSTNKQSLAFSKPPNGSSLGKGKERLGKAFLVFEKLNRKKKPKLN